MTINLQENPVSNFDVTDQFELIYASNSIYRWKHKDIEDIVFTGNLKEFNEFLLEKIDEGIIIVPEKPEPADAVADVSVVDTPADAQSDASVTETP